MKKFVNLSLTLILIVLYFLNSFTLKFNGEFGKFLNINNRTKIINSNYLMNAYLYPLNENNEFMIIDSLNENDETKIIHFIKNQNISKEQIKVVLF
jgi:hypothetical protein